MIVFIALTIVAAVLMGNLLALRKWDKLSQELAEHEKFVDLRESL